jgi:hypothetical protein
MGRVSARRPPKAELERRIESGLTLVQISKIYGVRPDTVYKWRIHYCIDAVVGINKPKNIECGEAVVVGIFTEEGEPGQYAVPGCGPAIGLKAARRLAKIMNTEMGG